MNILLVTPMPPQVTEPTGAIPMLLHALLIGLLPHHTITLVTIAGPDPAEWAAVDHLREVGITVEAVYRTEPEGRARWRRRWRFATSWLGGHYPWRTVWFAEPGVQPILDRLLNNHQFDIVHIEDNAVAVYQYRTQTPILLTEYEVRRPRAFDAHWWTRPSRTWALLNELDWQRWPSYQRAVWQRFDRVQVFTERDAASARELAPELAGRVRVNPFAIEIPTPLDPTREEPATLLLVGNFTHPPNVDAALWLVHEILPLLQRWRPDIRLEIVGNSPPQSVQLLAASNVIVTGRVPDVRPFFERASIVLAPIRTGGGMRMKVLQAMAMGKAVVVTPRGAEGLTMNGIEPPLAIAEDAQAFARATTALLVSDEARHSLGSSARAFVVEHFSPEAHARRLESIYCELTFGSQE